MANITNVTVSVPTDWPPCGHAEHFRVDAGTFTVRGPVLHATMTCVSGQPCVMDDMLGQHLMDGDRLLVLDSCGTNDDNLVSKLPRSGLTVQASASGSSLDFDGFAVTASGGVYQLLSLPGCLVSICSVDVGTALIFCLLLPPSTYVLMRVDSSRGSGCMLPLRKNR